jgi:pyruvate formate lyase activating enzyme
MFKEPPSETGERQNFCHEDASKQNGVIWKIDHFAIHDGPGIRTALYFKGCPLNCVWCSNPEGQDSTPILIFHETKCIGCEICIRECPFGALRMLGPGNVKLQIDRSKCNQCGVCISKCPALALEMWGKYYSADEVIKLLERDRQVYKYSGGGVTLTGGEALYQPEFACELLRKCHQLDIHTVLETCAYVKEDVLEKVLEHLDWLFIDLKHLDKSAHLTYTGRTNDLILNNVRLASSIIKKKNKTLVVRAVVIPRINDGQNISEMADFLCSLPFISSVELLPYHNYGSGKYATLGRNYKLETLILPSDELMEHYKEILRIKGLRVTS